MNAFHDMGAAKVRKSPVRNRLTIAEHANVVADLRSQLELAESRLRKARWVLPLATVAGAWIGNLLRSFF
jgi:hypothetical protein